MIEKQPDFFLCGKHYIQLYFIVFNVFKGMGKWTWVTGSTIPIRSLPRTEGCPNLTLRLPAIFDAIKIMANCNINTYIPPFRYYSLF